MGLFSFLKKKNDAVAAPSWPPPESRLRSEPSRLASDAERERQREIARATAAKIDEIELEFASDMFDDEPAWDSARRPANGVTAATAPDPEDIPDQAAAPASAPAVDESAILYANGQSATAEQLLRESLATLGRHERLPWWMLFDLYQADGREEAFESVAIDYASHFETSPPTWKPLPPASIASQPAQGVATVEAFDTLLDASVAPSLRRVLDAPAPNVRLDFGKVRSIDADGADCLLAALQTLRASNRGLVLAGADTLITTLRPMLVIGKRGASPAPWLLLLELLLLTNREKDFEEAAMDYCVTYEVSPPSFEAPRHVSTAAPAPSHGDRFMLPAVITSLDPALMGAIEAYAAERDTLVLDCSRLARIDYAGAGSLLARLDAQAAAGRTVELRELNHLVAALLRLLGAGAGVRLHPHRY
ncbi:anti-anti-sigma regulatory factor [Massilia sp. MP_M2]|uniref:STAS domain-containing protein n=1 Tax=Massilia sp. MP_M2 TaxID=3071713 RepID=UPI00319E499E